MYTHLHEFKFESEVANFHTHNLHDYTDYMVGVNSFHIHFFHGISCYKGHTHYFSGITSLPVKTEFGHIHKMEGVLETTEYHEHKFCNYTFEDTSFLQGKHAREADI